MEFQLYTAKLAPQKITKIPFLPRETKACNLTKEKTPNPFFPNKKIKMGGGFKILGGKPPNPFKKGENFLGGEFLNQQNPLRKFFFLEKNGPEPPLPRVFF